MARGAGKLPKMNATAGRSIPDPTPAEPVAVAVVPAQPTPASSNRAKPVRTTLVLDADEYDALQGKVLEAQRITGRRGVAGAEIVRNLLALAHEDPELWGKVLDRITENGGNRRGRK